MNLFGKSTEINPEKLIFHHTPLSKNTRLRRSFTLVPSIFDKNLLDVYRFKSKFADESNNTLNLEKKNEESQSTFVNKFINSSIEDFLFKNNKLNIYPQLFNWFSNELNFFKNSKMNNSRNLKIIKNNKNISQPYLKRIRFDSGKNYKKSFVNQKILFKQPAI